MEKKELQTELIEIYKLGKKVGYSNGLIDGVEQFKKTLKEVKEWSANQVKKND